MKYKIKSRTQQFLLLVFISAVVLFLSFLGISQDNSIYSVDISTYDSFRLENKMQIFSELDAYSNVLWNSKKSKTIKRAYTTTFPGLPLLVLDDRNNDGKADEFSYRADDKNSRTQEFGFFFDLNNDGRTDYLVYNGGPLFTSDFSKMFWMNYHLIDANGDSEIDIFVFNGVNIRGENFYDEGISAWIYDKNFDGVFDEAEYLGKDYLKKIEKKDGKFLVSSAMGETSFDERKDMDLWSHVIEDIDELLHKK